jgi:predicted alpha-1,2-mannosidase
MKKGWPVAELLMVGILATPFLRIERPAPPVPLPVDSVDPFIGVDEGGNTVPGAGIPFGFVWLSPDTTNHPTSGYSSAGMILGFSHTHVSGTGGASKYGNFLTTPLVGELRVQGPGSDKDGETASPGYYSVRLMPQGIRAELTATRLVGMHRYTFPRVEQAHVLIDVGSVIRPEPSERPWTQRPTKCTVRITAPNRIEGTGHFTGGWNPQPYTLHFSAEFDRPFAATGTWKGKEVGRGSTAADREHVGSFATFDTSQEPQVQLKLGVSFVSVAKARANLEQEIPHWDFDAVRRQAKEAWEKALAKIQVEGGTEAQRKIFYTALYHSHFMPHDLTGENVWWESAEPHYEDFYCLWDTFRTLHPLLTVIQSERQRDMVRSLVDTYLHTGWMPDARIAGANGMTQGGSNSDVLIADAIVKGLPGIDYEKAYQAMVKNGEVDSPRPLYEGREVAEYKTLGYLSLKHSRSASRTMEYAYNDFCLALVAKALGRKQEYRKYLERSRNWMNLWDPTLRSIRPRYADGRWLEPFSPTHNYPDEQYSFWEAPFYEGNGWQYSTYVPHDVRQLIILVGGEQAFVEWLDEFFDHGIYHHRNEPGFLAAYLYIHAGRPDRTVERVRRILATEYSADRNGLPGNDDAGAMSSWYVWGAIGLYPNAGQPFYYIGSPLFRRIAIHLGDARVFVIEAPDTSETNRYVQNATLDGAPLQRAWLMHSEVARGGRLVLQMGPQPSTWGHDMARDHLLGPVGLPTWP